MRSLLCVLLFTIPTLSAIAQKTFFIYLQTDNMNPFYVKMGDKIYSSSTSGYLILSNLSESTYHLTVGFPSNSSESKFAISMDGKDKGFLIKNLQSGRSLFNLQTLSLINEQKDHSADDTVSYQKRNDDFASILSKAANDTSLLYAAVKKEEPFPKDQSVAREIHPQNIQQKAEDTKAIITSADGKDTMLATVHQATATGLKAQDTSAIVQTKSENIQAAKTQITQPESTGTKQALSKTDTITTNSIAQAKAATFKRSNIKKHSESSTSEGFGLVYYDEYEEGADTVRLIIPNPKFTIKSADTDTIQSNQLLKREEVKSTESNTQIAVKDDIVDRQSAKVSALAKNCTAVATDNDFFKLRKTMAAKETDEVMIQEAKKTFRTKCFTTEQIKNLSTLFLTSAGKYQFFDAAYLHVTDPQHFSSLESEIRDDYYRKRFKALVGE